tara:strand:+ start:1254 stop:1787 length:534 start_codon:yes stop_codon:yes gene_type:complete
MKTLYTLLFVFVLSLPVTSQTFKQSMWTPTWEQEQDDELVVGFIPSLNFTPPPLLGTIGLSTEAQFYKRIAIAPTTQFDLLGRYYSYGFHCTAFIFTSRTTRVGFGYQRMKLNILQDRDGKLSRGEYAEGDNLDLIYLDSRVQINEEWDLRAVSGVSWNHIQFSLGVVYRFVEDNRK